MAGSSRQYSISTNALITKSVGALGICVCMFAVASPASAAAAFVQARLVHIKDVSAPLSAGEVTIDATWKRTFRIERVLIGRFPGAIVQDVHFSGQPKLGLKYYLLINNVHAKSEITWSGLAGSGICIEPEVIKQYFSEDAIMALQRNAPCKF